MSEKENNSKSEYSADNSNKSEKDWFLYKDLEDHVVHTWSRREKAEEVMNLLTCHKAEITEDIPAPALARSTEKKQKLKVES